MNVKLQRFPEKYFVRKKAQYLPKTEGFVNHHWSYAEQHAMDTIRLSKRDHKKIHKFTKYDQRLKLYRTKEGDALDTREKHVDYIKTIKNLYPESLGKLPIIEYEII